MTRCVLFDYDDTLVQTRQCRFEAIRAVGLRTCGYGPSDEQIEEHWGKPYRELFDRLFERHSQDIDSIIRAYEGAGNEFPMRPHDGALRCVDDLLQDRAVGIVTSASRVVVRPQLECMGFPVERLACIQTAEDTRVHKPNPAVFDGVMRTLLARGIERSKVAYVGDAYTDFYAARSAGLRFFGIPRDPRNRRLLVDAGVTLLAHLDELAPLVRAST